MSLQEQLLIIVYWIKSCKLQVPSADVLITLSSMTLLNKMGAYNEDKVSHKRTAAAKFDEILDEIGGFGLYQKWIFLLTCYQMLMAGMFMLNPVFLLGVPEHRSNRISCVLCVTDSCLFHLSECLFQ